MVYSKNIYSLPFKKKYLIKAISDPRAHFGHFKEAIDFALPEGTKIFAPRAGQVIDMKIRIAKIEDVPSLLVLFMEQEKSGVSFLPKKYKSMRNKKKPLKKHIKLALEKDIKQKNSRFLVMEDNEKIVGYIFGEIRDSTHPLFKRPKSGELSDMAVLKTYQGKGIAGKLWKELLDWFTKKKCK
ncbi:MAG: GNAT family N-acetyltransferase, partial [Nanoarchaeota archaeon]|nr:GNAT family N-acetyltransferase [Nanoarchaeota archaeon]